MSHSQSGIYQLQLLSMGIEESLVLETCLQAVCSLLLITSGIAHNLEHILLVGP